LIASGIVTFLSIVASVLVKEKGKFRDDLRTRVNKGLASPESLSKNQGMKYGYERVSTPRQQRVAPEPARTSIPSQSEIDAHVHPQSNLALYGRMRDRAESLGISADDALNRPLSLFLDKTSNVIQFPGRA
jgi:hypothetical protein